MSDARKNANHPLTALLIHLQQAARVSEIELDVVSARFSTELAQQMAGHALDPEILSRLCAYADGFSLFLIVAFRAGAGQGKEET